MCVGISIYIRSHVQKLGQKPIMIQSCISKKTEIAAEPRSTGQAKLSLVERIITWVERKISSSLNCLDTAQLVEPHGSGRAALRSGRAVDQNLLILGRNMQAVSGSFKHALSLLHFTTHIY